VHWSVRSVAHRAAARRRGHARRCRSEARARCGRAREGPSWLRRRGDFLERGAAQLRRSKARAGGREGRQRRPRAAGGACGCPGQLLLLLFLLRARGGGGGGAARVWLPRRHTHARHGSARYLRSGCERATKLGTGQVRGGVGEQRNSPVRNDAWRERAHLKQSVRQVPVLDSVFRILRALPQQRHLPTAHLLVGMRGLQREDRGAAIISRHGREEGTE